MATRRIVGVLLGIGAVIAAIVVIALVAGWLGFGVPPHVVAASIGGAFGTGVVIILVPMILPRLGIRPKQAEAPSFKSSD